MKPMETEAEDAEDAAIFDRRMAELRADPSKMLPAEVSRLMLRGDRLLTALRKWRNMTQMHLAFRTGLPQEHLSEIEAGTKSGTRDTLKKIAKALDIDVAWITPDA